MNGHRLYMLRMGPPLGAVRQEADEVAAIRALFLSLNRSDSLRLLCPSLLSFNHHVRFATPLPYTPMTYTDFLSSMIYIIPM
jgi:hypothetical protein